MYRIIIFLALGLLSNMGAAAQDATDAIAEKVKKFQAFPGYFPFYWDEKEGKIWLEVDKLQTEFLYVNGLTAAVGSNDIGLDRNQLGGERIVKFVRLGPKLLLQQPNYDYRAISPDPEEVQSVGEAFASSVLWGFRIEAEAGGRCLIDFTPFLMRDAHGVANRLRQARQGNYAVESTRSGIFLERTKNFPQNSEFEALITFVGDPQGAFIRSVVPSADAVTVRMHHSLVALPPPGYQPRTFDPRSGYFLISYKDYATPIESSLVKRFITRHRLEKKDPTAALSDPVEPIIYYLDRGAPEPIRSALLEGASWWNQAFEAAGYRNAFQVKMLPPDADPMDVRYNVINWVHRSTRGWSYGSSVTDPRTGEIIKGHVLLGSLRIRQDFLIAQGLVEAYENGTIPDPRLKEMALARLRQLSAHEVGHTLGLAHNYVASANNRASVMDYPHPYITLNAQGEVDFSQAYAVGIGDWDKRAILYGYQHFPPNVPEQSGLQQILTENIRLGQRFLSDADARPASSAHPANHLWDSGDNAVKELRRLAQLRAKGLAKFGVKNIPVGAPMGTLEQVLVPLYLMHRYQAEAVAKIIGGVNYDYAVRGDGLPTNQLVADTFQREALSALLETLDPAFLALPETLIRLLPPQPEGYDRDRESFKSRTGLTFDPLGAAESSVEHTLQFLLEPARLARLVEQHARDPQRMSMTLLLERLFQALRRQSTRGTPFQKEINRLVEKMAFHRLLALASDPSVMPQVAALALHQLNQLEREYRLLVRAGIPQNAHYQYLIHRLDQFRVDPGSFALPPALGIPDGAPIGCDFHDH